MQEEITNQTVTLVVKGARMTEQVFEQAVKKFLEEMQKSKQPKIYRGKQTLKQLASQNADLANIKIPNEADYLRETERCKKRVVGPGCKIQGRWLL